jgi:uncharacterized protein (UPF0332 family)
MMNDTRKLIDKAARAITAAEVLLRENQADFAAGRAYYAMFYAAEALLGEKGLHFRKHAGVHAAFGEHFAKTARLAPKFHRWLLDACDLRLTGEYGLEALIAPEDARRLINQAQEFLQEATRFLGQAPGQTTNEAGKEGCGP